MLRGVGIAAAAGGLYLGYGVHATAVGASGTADNPTNIRNVDCGTAFMVEFDSPNCDDALSDERLTSILLLTLGAAVGLGASALPKHLR